jgi:hypothetical protein
MQVFARRFWRSPMSTQKSPCSCLWQWSRRRRRNLLILVCGGDPRCRRRYLLDVTIWRPSLSLSIRLVHRTLIVHFQRWFPSPFCFILVYESLESRLTTFIFLGLQLFLFSFFFHFFKEVLDFFLYSPFCFFICVCLGLFLC